MSDPLPKITIVLPVFNEEPVLPELLARLRSVMDRETSVCWNVVFVDDGSRDSTAALLAVEQGNDARMELLRLSRNFGHQAALAAGLDRAREQGCDAAITLDADLQDPPELMGRLVAEWRAGSEVVLAVRESRQDRGLRRVCFDLFHRQYNSLTDFPIRQNTGTFGLLGRDALEALASLPERHRFFPGLRAWVGFRTAEVFYERQARAAGTPGQTLRRLVRYALDGIFSFSYLPLRLLTYIGLIFCSFALVLAIFFIIRRLLGVEIAVTGFTTLVCLILMIGGIQLVGIGVLGEYLARVYDEVKKRPLYILRRK